MKTRTCMAMHAEDVVKGCDRCIQRIMRRRHAIDRAYLHDATRRHNWWVKHLGWFRWIGGYRLRTHNQMHAAIMAYDNSFPRVFSYPTWTYGEQLEKVQKIKALADKSIDGLIYLTAEDHSCIF